MQKVSGFTFIKHGLTLGYPFIESIRSLIPLCQEIIVVVGFENLETKEDDGTYVLLQKEFSHEIEKTLIKLIPAWWDPNLRTDGLILSQQTNIALSHCSGDIAQYLQGDEILHEQDYPLIRQGHKFLENNDDIDGLIFQYHHFYGNVNTIKVTKKTYRQEVRTIRLRKNIISWKDAQGFRYADGQKIPCLRINAFIYHYGWARSVASMKVKLKHFTNLYKVRNQEEEEKDAQFRYERVWGLRAFHGTHPQVLLKWIQEQVDDYKKNNQENPDLLSIPYRFRWKDLRIIIADFIENITGHRLGEYKNFLEVRRPLNSIDKN